MNIEQGIYSILTADTTLTAMLSSTTAIFQEVAPEGTENPCIVFTETVNDTNPTKDGVSILDIPNLQVDVYANTISERNTIAARARTTLDGYSGTADGIVFDHIMFQTIYKLYDDIAKCFRASMDFQTRQKL